MKDIVEKYKRDGYYIFKNLYSDWNKSTVRSKRFSENFPIGLNDNLKRNFMQSAKHDLKTRDYTDEYTDGSNYYYI